MLIEMFSTKCVQGISGESLTSKYLHSFITQLSSTIKFLVWAYLEMISRIVYFEKLSFSWEIKELYCFT